MAESVQCLHGTVRSQKVDRMQRVKNGTVHYSCRNGQTPTTVCEQLRGHGRAVGIPTRVTRLPKFFCWALPLASEPLPDFCLQALAHFLSHALLPFQLQEM